MHHCSPKLLTPVEWSHKIHMKQGTNLLLVRSDAENIENDIGVYDLSRVGLLIGKA